MAEQEHKHGTMDVTEQERTFGNFVKWSAITLVIVVFLLMFLALTQT